VTCNDALVDKDPWARHREHKGLYRSTLGKVLGVRAHRRMLAMVRVGEVSGVVATDGNG
jgi:hypothetical protein